MDEIVWLARGVLAGSAFLFLVGLFGATKWFGTWELDRRTVVIASIAQAFGGFMLLAGAGAV